MIPTRWELLVKYGEKNYTLIAEVVNYTTKTMKIKVYGMKSAITLRNNYPGLHAKALRRPMMWLLIDGSLDKGSPNSTKLLADIIQQLEALVRNEFPIGSPLFY